MTVAAMISPLFSQEEDGTFVNNQTGEVLSPEQAAALETDGDKATTLYRIESRDDAEQALEKRSILEAELLAIEARKKAAIANFDTQITQLKNRIQSWEWHYKNPLIDYARDQRRGKLKSVTFDNGTVAWRDSAQSIEIIDDAAAAAWVALYAPERVDVKRSVKLKELKTTLEEAEADPNTLKFLKVIAACEKTEIKTNVKKEKD